MPWSKQEVNTVLVDPNNIDIKVYTSDSSANPPNATRVVVTIKYDDGSTDMKDDLIENFFSDPTQAATVKEMLNIVIAEYLASLGYQQS